MSSGSPLTWMWVGSRLLYPGFVAGGGDLDIVDPPNPVLPRIEHGHAAIPPVADPVQQLGMCQPLRLGGGDGVPLLCVGDDEVADGMQVALVGGGCRVLIGSSPPARHSFRPRSGRLGRSARDDAVGDGHDLPLWQSWIRSTVIGAENRTRAVPWKPCRDSGTTTLRWEWMMSPGRTSLGWMYSGRSSSAIGV
jgi:hypothetical protein